MAKKLSKVQQKELDRIRENYSRILEHELESCTNDVEYPEMRSVKGLSDEYYLECLQRVKAGYICYHVYYGNSKTLEILQQAGYIDYKKDEHRSYAVDHIKLLDT